MMRRDLCVAGLILIGVASLLAFLAWGCAQKSRAYRAVPVDHTQFDGKIWDLNRRLCLERGGEWRVVWRGQVATWECDR
jgi:hypothetical protein